MIDNLHVTHKTKQEALNASALGGADLLAHNKEIWIYYDTKDDFFSVSNANEQETNLNSIAHIKKSSTLTRRAELLKVTVRTLKDESVINDDAVLFMQYQKVQSDLSYLIHKIGIIMKDRKSGVKWTV